MFKEYLNEFFNMPVLIGIAIGIGLPFLAFFLMIAIANVLSPISLIITFPLMIIFTINHLRVIVKKWEI